MLRVYIVSTRPLLLLRVALVLALALALKTAPVIPYLDRQKIMIIQNAIRSHTTLELPRASSYLLRRLGP